MNNTNRIGVLLLNIGTPDAPDIKSVRNYLKAFLSDPYVIALPGIIKWCLLHLFILPFRPKRTAHAYQKIWTTAGSPLLIHSLQLQDKLSQALGGQYHVRLGMRYGTPSIASAVSELQQQDCQQIIVLSLFPQYSQAATGSAIAAMQTCLLASKYQPRVIIRESFYADPDYIETLATRIKNNCQGVELEYFIFSFHGVPKRAINKSYEEQCYLTARLIAEALNLDKHKYTVSFQSRINFGAWLQPYTTQCFTELRSKGIKKIAVVCPSFVMDCLETLEEMGIRGRRQWQAAGGETFQLIPALNSHADWIQTLANWIKYANVNAK